MGEIFDIKTSQNTVTIPVVFSKEEIEILEKYAVIMSQVDITSKVDGSKRKILPKATIDTLIKESVRNLITEFNFIGKQLVAQHQGR